MDPARRLFIGGAAVWAAVIAAAVGCTPHHDGAANPAVGSGTARPLAVCDTVASKWREVPGVQVTQAESTAETQSTSAPVHACHVMMVAPGGLPASAWTSAYWRDSTRGWREILHWAGDGPDGYNRTYLRGAVRCQIEFEQDGGDDSDSTYIPNPRVAERTSCWSDSAGLTAHDTA